MTYINNDTLRPQSVRSAVRIAAPILEGEQPLIAFARTALVPVDEALVRTIPTEYRERPLKETMDYLLGLKDLRAKESTVLKGISEQMRAREYVVQVNGRNANLAEPTSRYVTTREHETTDKGKRTYHALDIVVESVETGGIFR